MIRKFNEEDINIINILGREIHNNYVFIKESYNDCIVFEDKEIIGFITYQFIEDYAEILDVFVHINHRNKSIGTNLIENCIEQLKTKEIKKITLEVNTNNKAAINLYTKNKFKTISIRKKYYENNTEDAYLMEREI